MTLPGISSARHALIALCLLAAATPAWAERAACRLNDPPPPPPAQPLIVDAIYLVFFDLDSAEIDARAAEILDQAVAGFSILPGCPAMLAAHADRAGPDAHNLALSRRRARNVAAYLRRRGVAVRLIVAAYGEARPLVDTPDGVREPQNRRVELVIVPAGAH